MLFVSFCSASEAGFPADNDTAAVCSAERFCVEGRLSQASAVNPGGYCDAYCNMFMVGQMNAPGYVAINSSLACHLSDLVC